MINCTGVVTTLAGCSLSGWEDGVGPEAIFSFAAGVSVDSNDTVYVADEENNRIRKILTSGLCVDIPVQPLLACLNCVYQLLRRSSDHLSGVRHIRMG